MTPQERDVIAGIFDRLKQVSNQPRDPEAEKLIAERLAQQPYAPYAMAQAVYVQEQALLNMQAQLEQLQAQVQQLQSQPQPAAGGFLSSLFGGGAPAQPAPAQPAQPAIQRGPVPPSGVAAPGMMPRQSPGTARSGVAPTILPLTRWRRHPVSMRQSERTPCWSSRVRAIASPCCP